MPCISGRYDPNIGPLVNVGIAQVGVIVPQAATPQQINTFVALIDTGATTTCIAPHAAQAFGLQVAGKKTVTSATHHVAVNLYIADLLFPMGTMIFQMQGKEILEFPMGTGSYQMLLGRDVICAGSLMMTFDGHFTFYL